MTQLVVIHQIFIAQRQREDPLPDQPHHFVLDQLRRAAVRKTAGKPLDQPDRPIRRPQQQGTRIRGDLAAVKPGHHRTPLNACKTEQIRATLCMHRVSPLALRQTVGPTRFSQIPEPDAPTLCEKCGLERLSPQAVKAPNLAGEPIVATFTRAPGNDASLGGLKVVTRNGWFAARPSGTEAVYKIYAESFKDEQHLQAIVEEAQQIVANA